MALLSPGVEIKEKDFTTIVPTVSASIGGIAGRFVSGPIGVPVLISTEDELVTIFGKPVEANANEWFAAAEFLKYANKLWAVRAETTGVKNANSGGSAAVTIINQNVYDQTDASVFTAAKNWIARVPGERGNDLTVFTVDASTWAAFKIWADANAASFPRKKSLASYVSAPPGTSYEVLKKAGDLKNDEVHIFVIDAVGRDGRQKNEVLEIFEGVSKAVDATNDRLESIYYPNLINNTSQYIYFSQLPVTVAAVDANNVAWGSDMESVYSVGVAFTPLTAFLNERFSAGDDGTTASDNQIKDAYDELANVNLVDVNLIITAAYSADVVKHVIEVVVNARKDCLAFVTPHLLGKPLTGTLTAITSATVAFKSALAIADEYAMYGVMDSGFKYINDRYNNKFRWVPLSGDVAGLCAKVDQTNDAWWSPAGYNRGGIKNVLKLSFNPTEPQRDILYPVGINPVVSTSGSGTILLGDKTMTSKPSAFDRINVRRLFNILEKSISISAKYQLFEFNDAFTRAQFKGMVEPFLRNIQGRRGITDFLVVCDGSNNTGDVIDRNEFIADIYIKPARSINFITLNFVATKTGVDFSTVIGG